MYLYNFLFLQIIIMYPLVNEDLTKTLKLRRYKLLFISVNICRVVLITKKNVIKDGKLMSI